jgi:hypothetical protein
VAKVGSICPPQTPFACAIMVKEDSMILFLNRILDYSALGESTILEPCKGNANALLPQQLSINRQRSFGVEVDSSFNRRTIFSRFNCYNSIASTQTYVASRIGFSIQFWRAALPKLSCQRKWVEFFCLNLNRDRVLLLLEQLVQ